MPKHRTQKEAFEKCSNDGMFYPQKDIDIAKIKSMADIAKGDFESGKKLKENLPKESRQWSSVYKLYYDSLHELVGAFLRFDRIKSDNHQCLFAYLCEKHPELEFNWDFFEKVRTKRNGINYYGTPITQDDWKEVEVQVNLYTAALTKAVEKKIKEFVEKEE
ncbi:hypothetical protein KY361_06845 [Candidatus Woesearchaeota archaeon]|nr:hypothetical protein [Candidatus Woesearchaeota archaeon]